ncbi:MAG: FAD-dependent oxidoreductase [Candidatus Omnitrophica bacterium]|nr:FAD-dependent oxidoreductase [Candidatus Omnitrophota bacterium]MDD5238575.1 FAD-dependent oxidoreductase [Candidatus Omnitrophota bacterium]
METVILGAGLAGISAARNCNGTIFEKEKDIGGTCRSIKEQGFIFDLGIHVLHTKNRYVLDLLMEHKNLNLKAKRRLAWIYSHKRLTKYPFQVNTYGLPKDIIAQCLNGFINRTAKPKGKYDNYEDWVYANFGAGISDHFYLPYSEKFWTVKAKELTTDWLDLRIPQPDLEDIIKGAISVQKKEFGPNAIFRYPVNGGIQRIAESMHRSDRKIIFSKEAVKIDLDKHRIHFNDHSSTTYKYLISTIPLPELLKIIVGVPKEVIKAGEALRYNSILCINLGIKKQNINSAHWIYFPENKIAAFRISFPGNFSRFTVPEEWSSLQAEVSYSKDRPIGYKDITEKVIKDLIKTKILKAKDKIKLINAKHIKYAYIIYDHNRINNLKIINKFLRAHNIYGSGRYGQWEYFWMDEAILSGKKIAHEIGKKIK